MGAHRWQGGARRSRKRCSSTEEVWDGGCSGVRSGGQRGVGRAGGMGSIGRDGGSGGMRVGGKGLNGWEGGRATVGRAGKRDARGRMSGAGSVGQMGGAHGDAGVRAREGTPGSVGRLDRWVQVIDLWSIILGDE
jgi:hypothetical protein